MYPYDEMGKELPNSIEELNLLLQAARKEYSAICSSSLNPLTQDTTLVRSILHWIERLERKIDQVNQKRANDHANVGNYIAAGIGIATLIGVIWSSLQVRTQLALQKQQNAQLQQQVDLQVADTRPYLSFEETAFNNGKSRPVLTALPQVGTNKIDFVIKFYLTNLGKTPASFFVGPSITLEPYNLMSASSDWIGINRGIVMPGQRYLIGMQIFGVGLPNDMRDFDTAKISIPIEYSKVGDTSNVHHLVLSGQTVAKEGMTATAETQWVIDSAD